MAPPRRTNNPSATLALQMLRDTARSAEDQLWRAAVEYVEDGRLTVEAAAQALGTSTATYQRRARWVRQPTIPVDDHGFPMTPAPLIDDDHQGDESALTKSLAAAAKRAKRTNSR